MPKKLAGDDIAPRVTLSLRTTPRMRDRLDADARRSGRALAVEVERRLELSYAAEDLLADAETQRLLFGFARALKGLALADGALPWHQNPALTWDRISERFGDVYTFDHELERSWSAEELEKANKPLPTAVEEAAAMKAAGARWATPDELRTFQWNEPLHAEGDPLPEPGEPIIVPLPAQPVPVKRPRRR